MDHRIIEYIEKEKQQIIDYIDLFQKTMIDKDSIIDEHLELNRKI